MIRALRHWLLALQFFTRIPLSGRLAQWVGYSPEMMRASAAHLPGVGWVIGAATAGMLALLLLALPAVPAAPWVAAVASGAFGLVLTGVFHEDGLADLVDGLGGSHQRERALEIMKDSRIGSFGASALVVALLLKCALLATLAQIHPVLAVMALFTGHVVSRFFPLWIMHALPYVSGTEGSKSQPLAQTMGWRALGVGLSWSSVAMVLAVLALPMPAWGAAAVAALLACAWMQRWLKRRLQGYTGDALGATQQVCELAFLLGLTLSQGSGL